MLKKTQNQFSHELFGQLTTILNDSGDVFFISNEVSRILDYSANKNLLERLDEDEKLVLNYEESVAVLNGYDINSRGIQLLTESGLYSAILGSKKNEAKEFKKWVTKDVLPTIRKTGSYSTSVALPNFEDPYEAALAWAKEYKEKTLLAEKIEEQRPKVEYFDAIVDRQLNSNFRDTAKKIGVREGVFIKFLTDSKFIYRDKSRKIKPYSQYANDLFVIKDWVDGDKSGSQTLITPKGVITFMELMKVKQLK